MWVRGSKANKTLEFQRPSDYIIYARHTLVFAVAWVLVGDLLCAAEVGHRNRSVGSGTMKLTKARIDALKYEGTKLTHGHKAVRAYQAKARAPRSVKRAGPATSHHNAKRH